MFRFVLSIALIMSFAGADAHSHHTGRTQQDTILHVPVIRTLDSAALVRFRARRDSLRQIKDSLQRLSDSLNTVWTIAPDSSRTNVFIDSLLRVNTVVGADFEAHAKKFPVKSSRFDKGRLLLKGDTWIPAVIFLLLLFFAILKKVYAKDMSLIFQSFVNNRVLGQISRESNIFSSWPFILLYILFGFTIGMLLYLSGKYFQLSYSYSGVRWLAILSVSIIVLFTLKIILIRVVGFLFDVKTLAGEYISILSLSYFNAAILYLPLILAFSLTPGRSAELYIYIAIALLIIVFFFQFLRAGINILSNTRFPKMYLIIYLCALEVCPLLILIKALRF